MTLRAKVTGVIHVLKMGGGITTTMAVSRNLLGQSIPQTRYAYSLSKVQSVYISETYGTGVFKKIQIPSNMSNKTVGDIF